MKALKFWTKLLSFDSCCNSRVETGSRRCSSSWGRGWGWRGRPSCRWRRWSRWAGRESSSLTRDRAYSSDIRLFARPAVRCRFAPWSRPFRLHTAKDLTDHSKGKNYLSKLTSKFGSSPSAGSMMPLCKYGVALPVIMRFAKHIVIWESWGAF